ncbi:hypothetical protein J6590_091385 [Homalodisca vitripennis]|nr:hypothetical protein J6590_091385 [Homalodisca vitripennis]
MLPRVHKSRTGGKDKTKCTGNRSGYRVETANRFLPEEKPAAAAPRNDDGAPRPVRLDSRNLSEDRNVIGHGRSICGRSDPLHCLWALMARATNCAFAQHHHCLTLSWEDGDPNEGVPQKLQLPRKRPTQQL